MRIDRYPLVANNGLDLSPIYHTMGSRHGIIAKTAARYSLPLLGALALLVEGIGLVIGFFATGRAVLASRAGYSNPVNASHDVRNGINFFAHTFRHICKV